MPIVSRLVTLGTTATEVLRPGDRLFAVSDPAGLKIGVTDIRKND